MDKPIMATNCQKNAIRLLSDFVVYILPNPLDQDVAKQQDSGANSGG